jgi:hypothetical protein
VVDRIKRPGKATLHLTVEPEVKAVMGKDISPVVNQYLRARFLGGIQGDIRKIDEEIERLGLTIDQAKGKIELLKGQKEAMQIEKERIDQAETKAKQNRKYAKYVYLKQILRSEGSLAGRQTAIRIAYGVLIRGEAAVWALTHWKRYFAREDGFDSPRLPHPFLDGLGKWFDEATGYVSYVGGGKDEEKEYQEFIDVSNQSKRLCFRGHTYSALERFCPNCTFTKDIYLMFRDGEFSGYYDTVKERDAYRELVRLGVPQTQKELEEEDQKRRDHEKHMIEIQKKQDERVKMALTDGDQRK